MLCYRWCTWLMEEGKVLLFLSFSRQRNKGLCRGEDKEGKEGRCLGCAEHLWKNWSQTGILSPLSLLHEHPPSSHIPSISFSFPAWPKRRQAVCWLRAGSSAAAQLLALEGLGCQRMSLVFAISSGVAQLETCIPRQADYCSSQCSLPLLSFMLLLPPFCKAAITFQGPRAECIFSFILNSVLGRTTFAAEACCSAPVD